MKFILGILFSFYSLTSFSQDSVSYKKEKANMFGTISLIMAPSILVATQLKKEDKVGKIFFGAGAACSIAAGILCLRFSNKKKVLKYSLFASAGIMDAFNQELLFHYPKVKSIFPCLNDSFWDPAISWENKYNSNLPFAETLLVGFTDAYHGTRIANKGFVIGGILTFDRKINLKQHIKQVLVCSFIYTLSKGATHHLINN